MSFLDESISPTIQDAGADQTRRAKLNLIGFTVEQDPANNAIKVTNSGTTSVALANLTALRAADHADTEVVTIASPVGTWVYSSSTGAGQADDGLTIVEPNDVLIGANGRWYNVNASTVLPTVAALRLATSGVQSSIQVQNYVTVGDGGGGIFDYDSTDVSSTDDGGDLVVAGTRRYKRRKDLTQRSTTSYGAKADNATSQTTKLTTLLTALGNPATRTRAEHVKFPNGTTAHDGSFPLTNFSGVLSGAGAGSSKNNQSAHRWIGITTDPMFQLKQSWGTHIENMRFIGDPNHKPGAAIDLNAAGGATNTNVSIENVWIGGMSGNDDNLMATAMIATGTSPPAVVLGGTLTTAYNIRVEITTGGTLVSTNVRFRVSLDRGATWVASNVTATASPYTIPTSTVTLTFPSGTYTNDNVYVSDYAGFTSGITCSGSNLQNDQSLMIKCHFENIKDYGVDFQQSQNVLWGLLGCSFNGMKASVRTKTRHTLLQTSFHSVVENVVQLDGDSDITVSNIGAEQCGRLIYGSAGSGTGNGLSIHGGYFQCSNRYGINNVVDLQGGGSQVHLHIKDLSFTNDDMAADQAKIAITDSNHVALYLDNVSWYDGHSAIPHLAVATTAAGHTRWVRFDHLGVPYQNFWTHGDHANRQLGLRHDMPVGINLPPSVYVTCVDDSGNTHNLVGFSSATSRVALGDATTPIEVVNDIVARVSGVDITGFRNILALQGKINYSEANATPGFSIDPFTTNAAGAHDWLALGQVATGTGATVGGGFVFLPGTGNTGGAFTVKAASGTVRLKSNDTGLGLYTATPVAQATRAGQITDSTGSGAGGAAVDVTTTGLADPAKCNDNFHRILTKLNAIEAMLSAAGGGIGVSA